MVRAWPVCIYTLEIEHFTENEVEADYGAPQMDDKGIKISGVNGEQLKGFVWF